MPYDARNKLRSMGGIMASSPELMQAAAQRFNNGGIAMTTAPMAPVRPAVQYNDIMRPQMEPPVVGLGRVTPVRPAGLPDRLPAGLANFSMQDWRKMTRQQRKAAGLPVSELGGQLFFDRFGVGLGLVEPDTRYTSEGPVETEAERLMAGSSAMYSLGQQNTRDILSLPEVIVGGVPYRVDVKTKSVFRSDGFPVRGAEAELALKQAAEALHAAERATSSAAERRAGKKLEANKARLQELEEAKVGGVAPRSSAAAEEEAALKEENRALGRELGSFASAEDTVMAQEVAPSMTPEQMTEEGRKALEGLVPPKSEDPAEAEKIAQDAMSVLLRTQQPTGDGGDGGGGGVGDGEEAPAKSLEDYYKDARALISKVYGEEDDGVDNRMMDLAMIGLAIAAGQSPNALTNIAQGLLVGTQGIAERREAERERERGLRTLALETAIAQQTAATKAEREAARMDVEQQNRLELEREKARLGAYRGSSGSSGYEAVPRVAEQAITTATELRDGVAAGSIRIPDQYKDNPEAFITNERNKEMLNYIEGLSIEGQITDPRQYAALGQMYMYRDVDPEDPEAGQFPVVRSERELGFILPGQSYLRYNPSTGKYTRETKPASE